MSGSRQADINASTSSTVQGRSTTAPSPRCGRRLMVSGGRRLGCRRIGAGHRRGLHRLSEHYHRHAAARAVVTAAVPTPGPACRAKKCCQPGRDLAASGTWAPLSSLHRGPGKVQSRRRPADTSRIALEGNRGGTDEFARRLLPIVFVIALTLGLASQALAGPEPSLMPAAAAGPQAFACLGKVIAVTPSAGTVTVTVRRASSPCRGRSVRASLSRSPAPARSR